jgi:polar amino acid transport system permease protein
VRRLFFAPPEPAGSPPLGAWLLNVALVCVVLSLVFTFAFQQLHYDWNWRAPWRYRALFWYGWWTTVAFALAALVLSAAIGLLTALLGRSRVLFLRVLARFYVELVRGTPLLVQILIFFYVVAPVFRVGDRNLVGVLTLALFAGAYITEIVRAGIESVGKTQWDAARAVGLTRKQTYLHVVLPQALRQVLPPLAGQFVSLIKDSSLLSVIGVSEFAQNAQQVNALTYSTLEGYLPLALGYLILTLPLSLWTRHLERRLHYET